MDSYLEAACKLERRSHSEKVAPTDYQAPYKPAQLYVLVPVHDEADSSDYNDCFFSSAHE